MNEAEFRQVLSKNLIYYRKAASLTQAEAAARINYSDKSVSKWERGEGVPDVYVLSLLAEAYGVSAADLFADRGAEAAGESPAEEETAVAAEPTGRKKRASHSPFTICLAIGCVWLIATVIFSVLNMLDMDIPRTYLAFIYAIPASFGVMEFFTAKWKLPSILHLLFMSGTLWTLAVSAHLTAPHISNIYLLYVIAAVMQLLAIFAMGLYWQMIAFPDFSIRKALKFRRSSK